MIEFKAPHTLTTGVQVDASVHNIQPFLENGMACVFLSYGGKVLVFTRVKGVHMPQLCLGSDGLYRHGWDVWHNVPEQNIALFHPLRDEEGDRQIVGAYIGHNAKNRLAAEKQRDEEIEVAKVAAKAAAKAAAIIAAAAAIIEPTIAKKRFARSV